nr:siderophore-interacting protein [Glycomyces terrestris]
MLKLLRAKDFKLTVTGAEQVAPRYRRLSFADGGLLAEVGVHPAMWVRLWFEHDGKPHQRAYTLVDPDPAAGAFDIEFALHDGTASDWSERAQPGDVIAATVYGTAFTAPDPAPDRLLLVGDAASLPAINSLLDAFADTPATIWFETTADDALPFRTREAHDLRLVPRGDGTALEAEVRAALPALLSPSTYLWITCDARTTRALTAFARKDLGVPKDRLHAMAYWRP